MAGYREFQTGEVLTAANVNSFLMEQATMTFADAAARDAALAGVLREGLLTYNLDEGRLEVYDGTDWVEPAPEPPAGIGSNVVQTVKTDTFTTSSTSFTAIDGMSVTITPSSNTAKVLVLVTAKFSSSLNNFRPKMRLMRGSTAIFIGDTAGSRTRSSAFSSGGPNDVFPGDMIFLDSPNVNTATTYSLEAAVESGALFVLNRNGDDIDNALTGRFASSITVIEVAP